MTRHRGIGRRPNPKGRKQLTPEQVADNAIGRMIADGLLNEEEAAEFRQKVHERLAVGRIRFRDGALKRAPQDLLREVEEEKLDGFVWGVFLESAYGRTRPLVPFATKDLLDNAAAGFTLVRSLAQLEPRGLPRLTERKRKK
ncbi:MAG: hypothetical protein AB1405_03620 [Bdellovibrionota bacterium]